MSELLQAEPNELDEDHTSGSPWGPFVVGATMLAIGAVALKETLAIRGEGFAPEGFGSFAVRAGRREALALVITIPYSLQAAVP